MISVLSKFPIWHYLNQPLFEKAIVTPVLNPRRFLYLHRIELLERCLERECKSSGR
jgi:hypothetical protein